MYESDARVCAAKRAFVQLLAFIRVHLAWSCPAGPSAKTQITRTPSATPAAKRLAARFGKLVVLLKRTTCGDCEIVLCSCLAAQKYSCFKQANQAATGVQSVQQNLSKGTPWEAVVSHPLAFYRYGCREKQSLSRVSRLYFDPDIY